MNNSCASVRRSMLRLALAASIFLPLQSVRADNFGRVYYDAKTNELVIAMRYRGTNDKHNFSLKWGECQPAQSGNLAGVTAQVLDDQFEDQAVRNYRKVQRFSLADMPCPRPLSVTLRSAPHFLYTLTVPR